MHEFFRFFLRNLLIPASLFTFPGMVFNIRSFIHLSAILHFHQLHVRATSLQISLLFFKFQVVEYFLCTQKSFLPTFFCSHMHSEAWNLVSYFFFFTLSEREFSLRREMLKALHSVSLRCVFLAWSLCKIKRSLYSYLQLRLNNCMLHISYLSPAWNVKCTGSFKSPSLSRHCGHHELICRKAYGEPTLFEEVCMDQGRTFLH